MDSINSNARPRDRKTEVYRERSSGAGLDRRSGSAQPWIAVEKNTIGLARGNHLSQGKKLGFPWIPLAELGLFNGLRRIQIKIFSPFAYVAAQLALRLYGRIARLEKASMNFVFRE
jgi:hypothetical protein